jgi:L-ascorbate metabolism protein UlaG (beta-lactamase superfamily)
MTLLDPPYGFSSVQPVEDNLPFHGIEVFRTHGKHGPNDELGPVSGFVLRSQNEPTLYIAGDTIWCPEVEEALEKHQPEIVVVNAGAAQMYAEPPAITMTKEHVAEVCRHMPNATVIAVHMEAIDHCLLSRKELEDYIESEGLSERIRIPADGERIEL